MKVKLVILIATTLIVGHSCDQLQSDLNKNCPLDEDPKNPTVLPDLTDCTKFYKCLNGKANSILCPIGLHWSKELNRCDWPEIAKCDPSIKIPSTTIHIPIITSTSKSSIDSSTTEGSILHPLCPSNENPVNPTVLPHPKDCTKFYKCLYGVAHPLSCQPGLHWSSELNRCDWPEVAKCDPKFKISTTQIPTSTTTGTSISFRTTTAIPSTENPSKHPICPVNEDPKVPTVLPDPSDCTKFYKCVYGIAHSVSCPDGLHWSATLNRCDWPEIAKCVEKFRNENIQNIKSTEETNTNITTTTAEPPIKHKDCPIRDNPNHSTFLPYPNDCTKFYKCKHGLAIPMKCPSHLHFSTRTNRCEWPEVAGCDPSIQITGTPEPSTEGPIIQTLEPPKRHPDCPEDEDPKIPTYIPHAKDCSKFYKCRHGFGYLTACPSGLHWSVKLNRCEWPELAGCDPNIQITTPYPEESSSVAKEVEPPIKHKDCPKEDDPEKPVYLPYPGDCSKFYKCNNGFARAEFCPNGLHWSVKTNNCDWPKNANCNPKLSTKSEDFENLENNKKDISIVSDACKEKYQLIPHSNDCTKFFQCNFGIRKEKSCPQGTHFNAKLMICDHPKNAKCQQKDKLIEKNEEKIFHKDCPKDDSSGLVLLPYPDNCGLFYQCNKGYAHLQRCASGTHFNRHLRTCDFPQYAKCDKNYENIKNLPGPITTKSGDMDDFLPKFDVRCLKSLGKQQIMFSHSKYCEVYYVCVNIFAIANLCPLNTHWNDNLKMCDQPEKADCKKYLLATTLKNTNKDAPIFHKDCPDSYDPENPAHLPYPNDCNKFYKCLGKMAYPMRCPPSLHWSVEFNRCEWPGVAKCITSSTTSTTSTEPTTTSSWYSTPTSWPTTTSALCSTSPSDWSTWPDTSTPWYPQSTTETTRDWRTTSSPWYPSSTGTTRDWRTTSSPWYPTSTGTTRDWRTTSTPWYTQSTTETTRDWSTTSPPVEEIICKNSKDDDFLPHPTDCNKYVHCSNKKGYIKSCPASLYWNPKKQYCDYPEFVKCRN